jgi:ATP phosphoribosyltransferase regulatory subunit
MSKWLLPDYISDVLPSEARKIEEMRRCILDTFRAFGYELVMPPLLEYIDSLLTGTGQDLEHKTFKLLDVHTAKTMGIRADITPQIARIDAHLLNREGVTRLCYHGETLHIQPNDNQETRTPLQIGAEIYGTTDIQADIEILKLMYQSLTVAGVADFYISIGHAQLLDDLCIEKDSDLFRAVLTKDKQLIEQSGHAYTPIILELMQIRLYNTQTQAYFEELKINYPIVQNFIDQILQVSQALINQSYAINSLAKIYQPAILIDCLDLEGYGYHTGLIYNIYHSASHSPIAKGGRYDKVSSAFGRQRPATGFSINLRQISFLSQLNFNMQAVLAPWVGNDALYIFMNELRAAGKIVVQLEESMQDSVNEFVFTQKIVQSNAGDWVLLDIK